MTFEEINGMTFLEFLRKCKEAGISAEQLNSQEGEGDEQTDEQN